MKAAMQKSMSHREQYLELLDNDLVASGVLKWFFSRIMHERKENSKGASAKTQALAWQILEEVADGIVVTELDRRIVFANKTAKKLLEAVDARSLDEDWVLPENGTFAVVVDGHARTFEASSKAIRHRGRSLIMSTYRDITGARKQLERLAQQCFTDELTGLYNRRGFLAIAQHQIETARREKRRVIAIFADMDRLKEINDRLGHKAGDQAIIDLADILERSLRGGDIIARIGGDEFVILTSIALGENADGVIERLRAEINSFNQRTLRKYLVQASFGFEIIEPDGNLDLEEVIRRADLEMYCEKRKRRMERQGSSLAMVGE